MYGYLSIGLLQLHLSSYKTRKKAILPSLQVTEEKRCSPAKLAWGMVKLANNTGTEPQVRLYKKLRLLVIFTWLLNSASGLQQKQKKQKNKQLVTVRAHTAG